jgi:CRISPR-associated protein Csd1
MTILTALAGQYDRLAERGTVPPFGYSTERIAFALELAPDGRVIDVRDLRVEENRKLVPVAKAVPAAFKRPGITPRSFTFWDKTSFVLGVGSAKTADGIAAFPAQHKAFRVRHQELLAGTDDPGLMALLRFAEAPPLAPAALPSWWRPAMLDQNLVFILEGDAIAPGRPRFVHDRPAARRIWEAVAADDEAKTAMCLVSGRNGPIAKLHPAVKGVWGAQTSGASLVSFNQTAFTSYGHEQGDNAPVGEAMAFAYGTTLNHLLARGSGNRLQIGDASVVFWADAGEAGDVNATAAESMFALLMNPPPPTDAEEAVKVRDRLKAIVAGQVPSDALAAIDPRTRFFVLALSPNAARLSVRFWLESRFGEILDRVKRHHLDMAIAPPPVEPWKQTPWVTVLVRETALQEKADNVQPLLAGEVMRAVLTGSAYPQSLLAGVIARIRAGDDVNGLKAAICKAVLNRAARNADKTEMVPMSLDTTVNDPAYRLGRLFAVLENVQRAALGRVNASIRDRYFGAASATPASIFPLLLRGSNHHLSVLRKDSATGGLAVWFESEIGEILKPLDPALPRHLNLEQQGRFAVGYYHQRATRKSDADTRSTETDAAEG